jgi:hypothetical protein
MTTAEPKHPPKPPGNVGHLERLPQKWADQSAAEAGRHAAAGRLRHLIGVTVVVAMLDGIRDDHGAERIGFKGGSALLRPRASFRLQATHLQASRCRLQGRTHRGD